MPLGTHVKQSLGTIRRFRDRAVSPTKCTILESIRRISGSSSTTRMLWNSPMEAAERGFQLFAGHWLQEILGNSGLTR